MNLRILTCVMLALAGLGLGLAHADMETITLNDPDTAARQRPEVVFPHEVHMEEIECLSCHHQYEDGENVLDEDELEEDNPEVKCSFCHTDQASLDATTAFHRQCMGCHIDSRKAGEATGPEMCGSCHQRPE